MAVGRLVAEPRQCLLFGAHASLSLWKDLDAMVYRKGDTHGRYEFKSGHQTKLVPTSECFGLEVSETVNTSDGRANRDDFLPEDLWPNFNEMVTKLQECYVHMKDLFVSFLHHHAHLLFFP